MSIQGIRCGLVVFSVVQERNSNFYSKRSGKKQTNNNFYKSDDTFEIKFARHVSVVQRPSSVESRINLKLHLNL